MDTSFALAISFAVILNVISPPTALADFDKGLTAYTQSYFSLALPQWEPIAQQGQPNAQYPVYLVAGLETL